MNIRDSQRSKVYAAERVLKQFADECTIPLLGVADIAEYTRAVRSNYALRRRYEKELQLNIYVGDGRGRRRAGGDTAGIYMPMWSRRQDYVLHEIAHCIQWRRYGAWKTAGHGFEFCAIYLDLVRFCIGREAYEALKASFRKHKVRFAKKRTIEMSDERREILRNRMAVARSARRTTEEK